MIFRATTEYRRWPVVTLVREARPLHVAMIQGLSLLEGRGLSRRSAMFGFTIPKQSRITATAVPTLGFLLVTLVSLPAHQATPEKPANPSRPADSDESLVFDQKSVTLVGNSGEVWQHALSPDGKTLAAATGGVGDKPGDLRLWNVATGKERGSVKEHAPIRCVAYSRDGKLLATGEFDHTAKL